MPDSPSPREVLDQAISEEAFQRQVVQLAHLYGWRVHATRPAWTKKGWKTPIQGDKGFPDLVLVKGGRLILAELKKEDGHLTQSQGEWLVALKGVSLPGDPDGPRSFRYFVWWPSDWETIVAVLRDER